MNVPFTIRGPWVGFVDDVPPLIKEPTALDLTENFITYAGRLTSRPRVNEFIAQVPGNPVISRVVTFHSENGQTYTTLICATGVFHVNSSGLRFVGLPGGVTMGVSVQYPYDAEVFNGRLYFCHIEHPLLYDNGDVDVYVAGDVPGGSFYVNKLGGHLLIANTLEGSTSFTQRVRWSAPGNGNLWTGFGTGANDLTELNSEITGLLCLQR